MDINVDKIRELADLAIEKNLAELKVEDGDKSVTIKLPSANVMVVPPGQVPVTTPPPGYAPFPAIPGTLAVEPSASQVPLQPADPGKSTVQDERLHKITSPMVGTFYASPSPESPPFVAEGQSIAKGQAVCIIEAMKMMNELEAEVSGRVVKVLAQNGQPVEFGQVLMLVEI